MSPAPRCDPLTDRAMTFFSLLPSCVDKAGVALGAQGGWALKRPCPEARGEECALETPTSFLLHLNALFPPFQHPPFLSGTPLPSPHALRNRKCSPRPAAVVGGAHRDGVPVQVRGDLPQVQQLLLRQEAGLRPDGIQDGSRVALSGVGRDERPGGHGPGRQYLGAAPPRTPRAEPGRACQPFRGGGK